MEKFGLAALAEVQGQRRQEFEELEALCERVLEHLTNELTKAISRPIEVVGSVRSADSIPTACNGNEAERILVLGIDGQEVVAALRIDQKLSLALIGALLGKDQESTPANASTTEPSMTATEIRILDTVLGAAFVAAVKRAFNGILAGEITLSVMPSRDSLEALRKIFGGADRGATAALECSIATKNGSVAVGLPLTLASKLRTNVAPLAAQCGSTSDGWARGETCFPIRNAAMCLEAVLGSVKMPLQQIRALTKGSIILLDKLSGGLTHAELCCGGYVIFSGTVVEDRGWHKFVIQKRGA